MEISEWIYCFIAAYTYVSIKVYICVYTLVYFLVSSTEMVPKAICKVGAKILPSKYYSTLKGMCLGEMDNSRTGAGKHKISLQYLLVPEC